jgi:ribosomal protein L11 methylase PrmA
MAEERFDLIVANISSLTIERLAGAFGVALKNGGVLIVSGFLEDAVAGLSRVFAEAGLRVDGVEAEGVWRTMVAGRSGRA